MNGCACASTGSARADGGDKAAHPLALSLSKGTRCLVPLLALAACKQTDPPLPKQAEGPEHIACAVGGAKAYSDACAVEREARDGTLFLTVRHPDGAFRRFEVLKDGRGVAVADGAQPAQVAMADGRIDVTVEQDRYRFPVTVRPAVEVRNDAARR